MIKVITEIKAVLFKVVLDIMEVLLESMFELLFMMVPYSLNFHLKFMDN